MKPSKSERRKQQKIFERKQKRKNILIFWIIGLCVAIFILIYKIKPITIGDDIKYDIFVVTFPIAAGLGLSIFYRERFLDAEAVASTDIWRKIGYSIVLLFAAALLSYVTLGNFTSIAFETTNYYIAKNERQHTIVLPVDEFHKGKGRKANHSIRFHFNGEKEYIRVSRNFIHQCIDQSATKHRIKLKIRKGIWNHYLVDDWDIVK